MNQSTSALVNVEWSFWSFVRLKRGHSRSNFRKKFNFTCFVTSQHFADDNCWTVISYIFWKLLYNCFSVVVSNSVASASSCSFPFTFNGEIHLQCAVNQSNVTCDIGCFLIGRVWVTCTADSIGISPIMSIVRLEFDIDRMNHVVGLSIAKPASVIKKSDQLPSSFVILMDLTQFSTTYE